MLSIISWNVNGIRAVVKKDFSAFLSSKKPDILGLQEIKITDKARFKEAFDFKQYVEYWNPAIKPGYAGTAIFVRNDFLKTNPIIKYTTGIPGEKFSAQGGPALPARRMGGGGDEEGRVQTLEFSKFFILNIYFPHTRHDLSRLDFKLEFNEAVLKYVKKLAKKKSVIVIGDYNVAHQEIDLARPDDNEDNPGFLPEERDWMTKFLNSGLIDSYRYLHPQTVKYSWWSYRFKARERNIGWRIDYVCVSNGLKNKVKNAFIWDNTEGSDHCPVGINLEI